jgi:tetratricopeptide (TPR) repeat protein
MSRPSARRLLPVLAVFCWLSAGAADDPRKIQAPAGVPKKAGVRKKAGAPADGSKKVAVSIAFLTEVNIVQVAIDTDPFVAWVKPIVAAAESRFRDESSRRTVVIQVTLHPDRAAEVEVAGQPAPSEEEVKDLLRAVDAKTAPRSKVVDCTIRVVAQINGGHPDQKSPLKPPLETPDERRFNAFQAASTAEKLALMRRWARSEALPILAASASGADAKFKGVRDLGQAIGKLDPKKPVDVAALTDRNPSYWRAMLEMVPGDPLIAAVRVALHAANGEIDQARRYSNVATFFDARKTASSRLLGEFSAMKGFFHNDFESRIKAGIALNDKGQLAEAMAAYDGVLKDYPGSAWAHYERIQTRMAMAKKEGKPIDQALADWPRTRDAILACDPLYEMMADASGQEDIFRLTRRLAIGTLFQDRDKTVADLMQYADIARDLEVYGFAAMLYWNIVSAVKPEEYGGRELLEDFLYCLEQLGVKDIKENFRGDHAAAFARIKADRKKRVEAGPGTDEKAQPPGAKPGAGKQ